MAAELVSIARNNVVNHLPGAERFRAMALAVKVTNAEECEIASADLRQIKSRMDDLDAERKRGLAPLKETVAWINNLFNPAIEVLGEAEGLIKGEIGRFHSAEKARVDRERQQAEEAARKEQERIRAEAAERQRIADAEALRKREEAAEALRAGDAAKAEQLQAQAEQVSETAANEAQELVEAASIARPVQVQAPAKVAGISMRDNWTADCFDLKAYAEAAVAGKAPLDGLSFDTTFMNKMAKAMKTNLSWPGVRAVNNQVVASSKKAA